LTADYPQTKIHQFIKAFVESKNGTLTELSEKTFAIKYPNQTSPVEYTYDAAVAREQKALLITPGSPLFQQILAECLGNGTLCQISLEPKENYEALLKGYFKDKPFNCQECQTATAEQATLKLCEKTQSYYHQINNGKIASVNVTKKEPLRYFLFYFSATFQNKLRPKNEETITVLMDDKGKIVNEYFDADSILKNDSVELQDLKAKLNPDVFCELRRVAEEKLEGTLKQKLFLFDLPLVKEK
jgi:hypothetical protein